MLSPTLGYVHQQSIIYQAAVKKAHGDRVRLLPGEVREPRAMRVASVSGELTHSGGERTRPRAAPPGINRFYDALNISPKATTTSLESSLSPRMVAAIA